MKAEDQRMAINRRAKGASPFILEPSSLLGLFLLLIGGLWLATAPRVPPMPVELAAPQDGILLANTLEPMHSPAIAYSFGWRVSPDGADPAEPDDPWREPSGVFEFAYQGREVALLLAPGDYWGYLYVTVDGAPANRLARIAGNLNRQGAPAGYTTLYAPQGAHESDTAAGARWTSVHRAANDGPHAVRVEVWRSWGQVPVRGIAVDALPPSPRPAWPGVLLLLGGATLLGVAWREPARRGAKQAVMRVHRHTARLYPRAWAAHAGLHGIAFTGALIIAAAIALNVWWLCWLGLLLLGLASLLRPAYWLAALAFSLPFYYSVTLPLLPARNFGLIDVGVGMGLAVVLAHYLLTNYPLADSSTQTGARDRLEQWQVVALGALVAWALVAAVVAEYPSQAWYEWRTVFLAGGVLLLLLYLARASSMYRPGDAYLVLGCWLAGGTVVALLALAQYAGGAMLITAEGVARVRGLYGSPNNLALYLERTLMVSAGLALFLPLPTSQRVRGLLWAATLAQLAALVLTFSKGALLLGLPGGLLALWIVGLQLKRSPQTDAPAGSLAATAGRPRASYLLLLVGLAILAVLMVAPFLGTERFRNLLDVSQGTGFIRVQLWRSAFAMAWEHSLLGVGPDNFLYAYRSRYLLPAAWQDPDLNHPHNLLLDGWTRLGLPGLALVLAYLGFGVVRLWRRVRSAYPNPVVDVVTSARERAVAAGLLAAAAAALAHGLIDASYALPDLMLVWVLLFHLHPARTPATTG